MRDKTYMMGVPATSNDPERKARIDAVHGKEIRVSQSLYLIQVHRIYGEETVVLVGHGDADPAYSGTDKTEYGYTHGGKLYRLACDVADDIERWIGGYPIKGENAGVYTTPAKKFRQSLRG